MAGVNKAIIIGNLGRDPEMRYTPDGSAVANFSIATSEDWTDKNSGEKKSRTEWHKIVAFRRLAEICGQYLAKGSKVYIEGRIQTREWEDKDGNRRWTTEIVANQMQMLDSKGNSGGGGQQVRGHGGGNSGEWNNPGAAQQGQQPQGQQGPAAASSDDEDIPF